MSGENSSENGDHLIARILDGDDTGIGNDLLKECWRGYPVERLSQLLRSDVESAVKTGVWIAEELAKQARPLLSDIKPLINHPSPYVRSYAIDVVNLAAAVGDAEITASAIERIVDSERSVRYSAFRLLAAAARENLEASCTRIQDEDVREALRSLLDEGASVSSIALRSRLGDVSRLVRLFGLVSAARISDSRADDLLEAIEAGDDEIRQFAFREARRRRLVPPTLFADRKGT